MSEDMLKILNESQEKHRYVAEVDRLMDLITNHLYRTKEVFLRELISNSVDALEKMRFIGLSQKVDVDTDKLDIRIEFDGNLKTISITDTGVGMTKDDLINNLGTVAKSGTSNFMEALGQSGGDVNLIGRFGVGFYAAYLVADKVTVTTKHDDSDQYIWESSADGSYTVAVDPRGNTLSRGTRITLHLKEDATEFLSESKLKELASGYGKFMPFPIYVKVQKTVTKEIPDDEQVNEETSDKGEKEEKETSGAEDKDEQEKDYVKIQTITEKKTKMKKVQEKVYEWELINANKAIWLRPKDEIDEKQYNEFYKSISKDWADPLAYIHFSAEGEIEFKSILYIPSRAPSDLFDNYYGSHSNIKLYVRRAFVGDKFDDLLPKYLTFVTGVVNSDDLPLNVSREELQQHKLIKIISKKLVKKVLDLIRTIQKESDTKKAELKEKIEGETDETKKKELQNTLDEPTKFDKFWKEYSRSIKLGCYEDDANRSKIAKVMRFRTSKSGNDLISLDKYIENGGESLKVLYYISGDSHEKLMQSPHMQIFLKKGIEVLFLIEGMDEPCIQRMLDYEGKKFVSIAKGDVEFEDTEDEKKRQKKLKKKYDPLLQWFQKQLSGKIQKVELSRRIVTDPCAVVASQWGYSAHMEKLMKSQTLVDTNQITAMSNQKIFEINPNHPLMIDLLNKVKENDESAKDLGNKLFQAAMLSSGFDVTNPTELAHMIYEHISAKYGVNVSDEGDLVEVNVDDIPDEEVDQNKVDTSSDEKLNLGDDAEMFDSSKLESDGEHSDSLETSGDKLSEESDNIFSKNAERDEL